MLLNVSRIADCLAGDHAFANSPNRTGRTKAIIVLASFPFLFALLLWGDHMSMLRKRARLLAAAKALIQENTDALAQLANYDFSLEYVRKAESSLKVLGKIEERFPQVQLMLPDKIGTKDVFLHFGPSVYFNENRFDKADFIYSSSPDERQYLGDVFFHDERNHRFSASDGFYELYYPTKVGERTIVLYFTDRQQYGKFGS